MNKIILVCAEDLVSLRSIKAAIKHIEDSRDYFSGDDSSSYVGRVIENLQSAYDSLNKRIHNGSLVCNIACLDTESDS